MVIQHLFLATNFQRSLIILSWIGQDIPPILETKLTAVVLSDLIKTCCLRKNMQKTLESAVDS